MRRQVRRLMLICGLAFVLIATGAAPSKVLAQTADINGIPICPQQGDGSMDLRTTIGVGSLSTVFGRIYNSRDGSECVVPTSFRVVYTEPLNPLSVGSWGVAYWEIRSHENPQETIRVITCTRNSERDYTCPAIVTETGKAVRNFKVTSQESGVSTVTVWQGALKIYDAVSVYVSWLNYLPEINKGGASSN